MKKLSLKERLFNKALAGSQDKWQINDLWYKADDYNYEGLSEVIVSDMLKKSNVKKFTIYDPEIIIYKNKELKGCVSKHFLEGQEELFEISELLKKKNIDTYDLQINDFVNFTKRLTGLNNFDKYLCQMLELDMITLNTDRHFSNIAVIKKGSEYDYSPFFDQGRCFGLKDSLWENTEDPGKIIKDIYPRLYCGSFDSQTKEIEKIAGGRQLAINYGKKDLIETLDKCSSVYSDVILKRAEKMVLYQMDRYLDYFRNEEKTHKLSRIKERLEKEGLPCEVIQDEDYVKVKPYEDNEITFKVDPHKNITPLNDNIPTTDDDLLFNHENMYNFYKSLYYSFHEERTGNIKSAPECER